MWTSHGTFEFSEKPNFQDQQIVATKMTFFIVTVSILFELVNSDFFYLFVLWLSYKWVNISLPVQRSEKYRKISIAQEFHSLAQRVEDWNDFRDTMYAESISGYFKPLRTWSRGILWWTRHFFSDYLDINETNNFLFGGNVALMRGTTHLNCREVGLYSNLQYMRTYITCCLSSLSSFALCHPFSLQLR